MFLLKLGFIGLNEKVIAVENNSPIKNIGMVNSGTFEYYFFIFLFLN